MSASEHINKKQIDPYNPYITDKVTHWSEERKTFITTVYGLNPEGKRIVKYQALKYPNKIKGPD